MTDRPTPWRRLAALTALAILVSAVPAHAFSRVVSRNGRVGDAYVGKSGQARVRAQEGAPSKAAAVTGEGGVAATQWTYSCGRRRSSIYFFDARGILANFITTCRSWRTAAGTRVGMGRTAAEAREGKAAAEAACGSGQELTRHGRAYLFVVLNGTGSAVRVLAVAGRNSVLGC